MANLQLKDLPLDTTAIEDGEFFHLGIATGADRKITFQTLYQNTFNKNKAPDSQVVSSQTNSKFFTPHQLELYLDDNSIDTAWDNTQGKFVKIGTDGFFGLGSDDLRNGGFTYNSVDKTGFYNFDAGSVGQPINSATVSTLHFQVSGNIAHQVAVRGAGDTATRMWLGTNDGGTRNDWEEVWTTGNLTKTSNPTDSGSGKLLQVGDFGLGGTIDAPLISDLNDAEISGFYRFNNTSQNRPENFGTLLVNRVDGSTTSQIAIGSTGNQYYRYQSGGIWLAWDRLTSESTNNNFTGFNTFGENTTFNDTVTVNAQSIFNGTATFDATVRFEGTLIFDDSSNIRHRIPTDYWTSGNDTFKPAGLGFVGTQGSNRNTWTYNWYRDNNTTVNFLGVAGNTTTGGAIEFDDNVFVFKTGAGAGSTLASSTFEINHSADTIKFKGRDLYNAGSPNVRTDRLGTNSTLSRVAPVRIVEDVTTGNSTYTLADDYLTNDVVQIIKNREIGSIIINSQGAVMNLPNGTSGNSHNIPSGIAMTITLFRQGDGNWSLSVQG